MKIPYRAPDGQVHLVDAALASRVLDRLNRLERVQVYSVCAGHRGDQAHVTLRAVRMEHEPALLSLAPYLERLSSTEYRAWVQRYKGNGGRRAWYLEVRRAQPGRAPARWWHGLLDLLEDAP